MRFSHLWIGNHTSSIILTTRYINLVLGKSCNTPLRNCLNQVKVPSMTDQFRRSVLRNVLRSVMRDGMDSDKLILFSHNLVKHTSFLFYVYFVTSLCVPRWGLQRLVNWTCLTHNIYVQLIWAAKTLTQFVFDNEKAFPTFFPSV